MPSSRTGWTPLLDTILFAWASFPEKEHPMQCISVVGLFFGAFAVSALAPELQLSAPSYQNACRDPPLVDPQIPPAAYGDGSPNAPWSATPQSAERVLTRTPADGSRDMMIPCTAPGSLDTRL